MQIRYCNTSDEWNRTILGLNGTLFQSWQWGEWRKSTQGCIPWRLLLEDRGEVRAALQILEPCSLKAGPGMLYAPAGVAHRENDLEAVRRVVEWVRGFLLERRANFLRIDPRIIDSDASPKALLRGVGFRSLPDEWPAWNHLPRATMIVDLRPTEEELLRRTRKTHRQLIQRASRIGLEWDAGNDDQRLQEFYGCLLGTARRQGFYVHHFGFYSELRRTLLSGEDGQGGAILIARHEGKPIAAILCARFGEVCHWLYGGFDPQYGHLHPNEGLQWKGLQWAKSVGCRWYDMGGASTRYPPQEGNVGYGIYNFKKGFGAELRYHAGYFDLVRNAFGYRLFRIFETHAALRTRKLLSRIQLEAAHLQERLSACRNYTKERVVAVVNKPS